MMQENSDSIFDIIPSSSCRPPSSVSSQPRCETSFDSGYCASPARSSFIEFSSLPLSDSPFRMDPKMPSVSRQPFSPQKIVKSEAAVCGYFVVSPLKNSNASFSPFKNSTLSPFKQINQSPSKGTFDDWDKDFITSFEENLFGMHDIGDLSNDVIDELMKSPQGKAILQRRSSPVRVNINGNVARKIKISPPYDIVGNSVVVDIGDSGAAAKSAVVKIKEEPVEFYTVIKEEPLEETELEVYHEHNYHAGHASELSATDPDKMNATPMKPRTTYDGKTAPKRNLAFVDDSHQPIVAANLPSQQKSLTNIKENSVPSEVAFHLWPAKDRLRFARAHFRQILNKTVKEKIEKFRASQAVLNKQQTKTESKIQHSKKHKTTKHKTNKLSRKASKKDKYPQIKRALSKPAVTPSYRSTLGNSIIPEVKSERSYDPGWYPDSDDSDDSTWHGPMPFQRQTSHGFYNDEDDDENVYVNVDLSSDDEYVPIPRVVGKKKKRGGKGLGKKKRKY